MNRISQGRLRLSFTVAFWVLSGIGPTLAGTREFPDGWLHSPASLHRVLRPEDGNPQVIPGHGYWVATGQTRLFGMHDLPERYLAWGWSHGTRKPVHLELGIQTTGEELVHDTLLSCKIDFGKTWGIGLVGLKRRLQVLGAEVGGTDSIVLHARRQGKLRGQFRVAMDLYVPLWARAQKEDFLTPHQKILSCEYGQGTQSLALSLERNPRHAPQLDVELVLGLSPRFGLMLRSNPGTGVFGPGIFITRHGFLLMTSHLVHPVLGTTHRAMLVLGNWSGCRL